MPSNVRKLAAELTASKKPMGSKGKAKGNISAVVVGMGTAWKVKWGKASWGINKSYNGKMKKGKGC